MERGHTWTVLVLAIVVMVFGTFILTLAIPETFQTTPKSANHGLLAESPLLSPLSSRPQSPSFIRKGDAALDRISHLLSPFISLFNSNPQAVLLILICGPHTAARDVFVLVGLQYSNTKFSLPYAKGNLLLSPFQGAQGVVVLLILLLITRFLAERRGWAAWSRDRQICHYIYRLDRSGASSHWKLTINCYGSIRSASGGTWQLHFRATHELTRWRGLSKPSERSIQLNTHVEYGAPDCFGTDVERVAGQGHEVGLEIHGSHLHSHGAADGQRHACQYIHQTRNADRSTRRIGSRVCAVSYDKGGCWSAKIKWDNTAHTTWGEH